jgi:polysaccharide export outer membrane protein
MTFTSLAGGLDILRMKLNGNPLAEAADLNNELETLRVEYVKQQARIRRLQAEIEGRDEIDFGNIAAIPIPVALYTEITSLEARHMQARLSNAARDKESIERARNHIIDQLAAFDLQQKVEKQGLEQQTQDAARLKAAHDRGLAPLARLLDEQRLILQAQSRLASIQSQIMGARRALEELSRQLARTDEILQLESIKELQEGLLSLEKIRLRMNTAADKIIYVGAARNADSLKTSAFHGLIRRTVGQEQIEIVADESTELVPGDLLEISLARAPAADRFTQSRPN